MSRRRPAGVPESVHPLEWILLAIAGAILGLCWFVGGQLALIVTVAAELLANAALAAVAAYDVQQGGALGKLILSAGTVVFFSLDALSMALDALPFSTPLFLQGYSAQFEPSLVLKGLFFVWMFQLTYYVAYAVFGGHLGAGSAFLLLKERFDRRAEIWTVVRDLLVLCTALPLLVAVDFDVRRLWEWLLAGYKQINIETRDPGMLQHLMSLGLAASSLALVQAIAEKGAVRLRAGVLGCLGAAPAFMRGVRHLLVYVFLPVALAFLATRRVTSRQLKGFMLICAVVALLMQLQYAARAQGWQAFGMLESQDEFFSLRVGFQFEALLAALVVVPAYHEEFHEFTTPFFLSHWVPRQFWDDKPVMQSYQFYNDLYTFHSPSTNVTPSVIGQFYMNWGAFGVVAIALWLAVLAIVADSISRGLHVGKQKAVVVFIGFWYAFIFASFRFYAPFYFAYVVFAGVLMVVMSEPVRNRARLEPAHR